MVERVKESSLCEKEFPPQITSHAKDAFLAFIAICVLPNQQREVFSMLLMKKG